MVRPSSNESNGSVTAPAYFSLQDAWVRIAKNFNRILGYYGQESRRLIFLPPAPSAYARGIFATTPKDLLRGLPAMEAGSGPLWNAIGGRETGEMNGRATGKSGDPEPMVGERQW